jgi:hypothetical protein
MQFSLLVTLFSRFSIPALCQQAVLLIFFRGLGFTGEQGGTQKQTVV